MISRAPSLIRVAATEVPRVRGWRSHAWASTTSLPSGEKTRARSPIRPSGSVRANAATGELQCPWRRCGPPPRCAPDRTRRGGGRRTRPNPAWRAWCWRCPGSAWSPDGGAYGRAGRPAAPTTEPGEAGRACARPAPPGRRGGCRAAGAPRTPSPGRRARPPARPSRSAPPGRRPRPRVNAPLPPSCDRAPDHRSPDGVKPTASVRTSGQRAANSARSTATWVSASVRNGCRREGLPAAWGNRGVTRGREDRRDAPRRRARRPSPSGSSASGRAGAARGRTGRRGSDGRRARSAGA